MRFPNQGSLTRHFVTAVLLSNLHHLSSASLFGSSDTVTKPSTPAIRVSLKASWNGAPFLLELLETAALEEPDSYFPLLDIIASGNFESTSGLFSTASAITDQSLYTDFIKEAQSAGFLTSSDAFDFSLSIRAAAPRIEAHYRYYSDTLQPEGEIADCDAWVTFRGVNVCESELEGLWGKNLEKEILGALDSANNDTVLPLDRAQKAIQGELPLAVVYADITTESWRKLHKTITKLSADGKIQYRLRYKPSKNAPENPVLLSGYGVELVLKKTDYIVMDDRDDNKPEGIVDKIMDKIGLNKKEEVPDSASEDPEFDSVREGKETVEEFADEADDIKPVHPKDLRDIGLKASTYIMKSTDRLSALNRILQDFPKYSAALAATEVDNNITNEYTSNRQVFPLPAGTNIAWINGLQIDDSDMNAFALADHLRRERKTVTELQKLGLSTAASVSILSHPFVADSAAKDTPQRFDWRETEEETGAIVWLNNLAKDKRYEDWPESVVALTRQVYPGQIHTIRKNIHHLVLPLNLTDQGDLLLMTEQIQMFVQRMIALRFGIVPFTTTDEEKIQAKTFYHLSETYGLSTALQYFQVSPLRQSDITPEAFFVDFVETRRVRKGKQRLTLSELIESEIYEARAGKAKSWSQRLAVNSPSLFINGLAMPRGENWVQMMSQRLMGDVQILQRAALTGVLTEDDDLPHLLLGANPARTRNTLIFPEDDASLTFVSATALMADYPETFSKLPYVAAPTTSEESLTSQASIWVIGDFDQNSGYDLLNEASIAQKAKGSVSLTMIHNPEFVETTSALSALLVRFQDTGLLAQDSVFEKLLAEHPVVKNVVDLPSVEATSEDETAKAKTEGWAAPDKLAAGRLWKTCEALLARLKLKAGERALVINGRVVGPLPKGVKFTAADFEMLIQLEVAKRIQPVLEAAKALGVDISTPHTAEKLTSLIAMTAAPEPASMFDKSPTARIQKYKLWQGEHSSITSGNNETAIFHVVASLNPASEAAQKWVPILTVLSEMEGVYLKIFLNPDRGMTELPVKRFYRHVLNAKPRFDENGTLAAPEAVFNNIPEQALLTLGMEVPPSWLVAPVVSVHDLDNIKLRTFIDRFGNADITALYGLTHILIEGHSRDITSGGQPPRGAQIVLGTKREPNFADTIIMANLGYFQFKANPGFFTMSLKEGRSREVYAIDSLGAKVDEHTRDIALMSFKGVTLFPRLSRLPGMETEDVLEQDKKEEDSGVLGSARGWLEKIGVVKKEEKPKDESKADINIFSVASGHLYERFLNIMMVSVMRHTDKKVKFWFIENFLSPSFKDFIPIMAQTYNFQYELVTYKWPHWLRAQKEKQREIWGYKILFLDVLFPLDLDKVIFVDADQIVRTDLQDLVDIDLEGAPYGFTPMCDSRTEIEGFRFWKQGYWKNFLRGTPYHISALYVVDLIRFRQIAAGDRLRQTYHQLSADPNSLANLDQDLPNHMQMSQLPIFSLPQDWLWCETWCSDASLKTAKTIDLCNNPMTKEPKLDRARRQVPEWREYDDEVAKLAEEYKEKGGEGVGMMREALVQKEALGEEEKMPVDETVEKKKMPIEEVTEEVVVERVPDVEDSMELKDEL